MPDRRRRQKTMGGLEQVGGRETLYGSGEASGDSVLGDGSELPETLAWRGTTACLFDDHVPHSIRRIFGFEGKVESLVVSISQRRKGHTL